MIGFFLNVTGFVLNMTGFVLSMTVFVLNMTGFVQNMTGFVLNMTDFFSFFSFLLVSSCFFPFLSDHLSNLFHKSETTTTKQFILNLNFQSIGPLGRCFLFYSKSKCPYVCLCVCVCVYFCLKNLFAPTFWSRMSNI